MGDEDKVQEMIDDKIGCVSYSEDFMDSLQNKHPKLYDKIQLVIWEYFELEYSEELVESAMMKKEDEGIKL